MVVARLGLSFSGKKLLISLGNCGHSCSLNKGDFSNEVVIISGVKALLHRAMFRATCLATPFLQTFSPYKTGCFRSVTLSNFSCNLSRFDDHMKL